MGPSSSQVESSDGVRVGLHHWSGGARPARAVLYLHGATYPCLPMFVEAIGGTSWMEYIARRGFEVFALDLRGYGSSDRPPALQAPAELSPPPIDASTLRADLDAAVAAIRARCGVERVSLVAHSAGAWVACAYAVEAASSVDRLALFAPIDPPSEAALASKRPQLRLDHGYRVIDRTSAWMRWIRGIPPGQREATLPAAVFETWWKAVLATDPASGTLTPPMVRAPNRVWPRSALDRITAPVQITRGQWDVECSAEGAHKVWSGLANASARHLVELAGGSHHMSLEARRFVLYATVQGFLEEQGEHG